MPRLWILIALLAFGGVSAAPAGGAQTAGSRWALLVGVDDYEHPEVTDLRYTAKDVVAVGTALVDSGFPREQVIRMTSGASVPPANRPRQAVILRQLDELAKKVRPEDTFLFYFSGHGFSRGADRSFLGTVEANPTTAKTLESTTIPLSLLQRKMALIKAKQVVFIIDACRNDPLRGKGDAGNPLTTAFSRDLIRVAKSSAGGLAGSAVLFACSEGERAWEWPEKQHGSFTYYLLEGLRGRAVDPGGEVTVNGLADYVQRQVVQWSAERERQQTPDLRQDGAARIVLGSGLRKSGPEPVTDGNALRADEALRGLQRLLREHGRHPLRDLQVAGRMLFVQEDRLVLMIRFAQRDKLPENVITRVSAPIRSLDSTSVSIGEATAPRNPLFRVWADTKDGAREVSHHTKAGERRVTRFLFWFEDQTAAETAAVLLREFLSAREALAAKR